MKILETKNLSKRYGLNYAVDKVSMTIHEGDIYGFIGENGAGKTTFIRLVSGLIEKDNGSSLLFEGQNHHIGAVVETPSLYLYLSAMDNLMAQGMMLGKVDVERHKELLKLVKLDYLIGSKKKAKDFSLGMRQRLGIAMALLSNPKFLLLDEPMNGLDPEGVVLMRNLIKRLNEEGITFLISSHMLSELSKVASRYGFIHKGKLIKEITFEELEHLNKPYISIRLETEELRKAENLLKASNFNYKIDNLTLTIYDQTVTDIVLLLAKENIIVKTIHQETSAIENYYLNLIGGLYA
ncbi:MAG: ATP-binding cassette domain-containing protein [Acholeplasmataceae bacterium]